jgi:hypothetical protein
MRAAPGTERQLLFDAEPFAIDLRIAPATDSWSVAGQVLGPETAGEVGVTGPVEARAALSNLGEFTLPPLPAGRYTMTLRLGDLEVVIPELEIGL